MTTVRDLMKKHSWQKIIKSNFLSMQWLISLHLGGFKWDMAWSTTKTLVAMIEEAQKHTMAESIIFLEDNRETRDLRKRKHEEVIRIERPKRQVNHLVKGLSTFIRPHYQQEESFDPDVRQERLAKATSSAYIV